MQSEPTENPPVIIPSNNSHPIDTDQHGIHQEDLYSADAPSILSEGDRSSGSSPEPHSSPAHSTGEATLHDELRRLSIGDNNTTRPKPSFQRISEYENALSPSPPRKQNEGPGFRVIKRKSNVEEGLQLDAFPNEVLTHILSHLPAASLSAISLVSRRFHSLMTSPHAWRIAFSRFFPGRDAEPGQSSSQVNRRGSDQEDREQLRSEQRLFTRLTALSSWRSEYILRTRLIRSLGRGKPAQIAPGHGASTRSNSAANNANAVVTYSSQLFTTINHIHAVFGSGKKSPRFIHGTDESGSACTSDPNIGKIDNWGLSDPQALPQFADLFIGDQPYGTGDGPAGLPNSMDLSQPFGMVYGEGFPGGSTYFRSSEEMRGRFVSQPPIIADYYAGIPSIPALSEAISAVWIAKSNSVLATTDGLIGIMAGSTLGVVTAYSLGTDTPHGRRIGRGQMTAQWVLSPGVPIIGIRIDESYNAQRKASRRIWAVVLNALGEVFYLTETPSFGLVDVRSDDHESVKYAWLSGRSASWQLLEPSRRVAKDDPYHQNEIHGSYTPRSSSTAMRLSQAQVVAETQEIEKFLNYRPAHFRKICEGWDMRRKLEVDFAGDDGNGAGEAIFVIKCGLEEGQVAEIRRFARWKSEQASLEEYPQPKTPPMAPKAVTMASLFGGGATISPPRDASPQRSPIISVFGASKVTSPVRAVTPDQSPKLPQSPTFHATGSTALVEEWKSSILSLKDRPDIQITASAIDMSAYALLTVDEDPLHTINGGSSISSPFATPSDPEASSEGPIPGHRARFLAIGTKTGAVLMWNMRGPQSSNSAMTNELDTLRIIQTDSPEISCLAVSALYLVHGGNDGLVQSWDPLASTLQPVRTLNSRFSSRARRRLIQAQASMQGVGINLYAAGAIILDPDPTVLRGMTSIGAHLRYWSYSSSAADQYQSKKRRLRRSNERGSNGGPDRFTNTGRGALMDYIATEQQELKQEKARRSREEARLRGRFGVGLGGLSEEEALKYAEMISAEEFQKDVERRTSDAESAADGHDSAVGGWTSSSAAAHGSIPGNIGSFKSDSEFDHDVEEAIRQSLMDGVNSGGRSPREKSIGAYDIPITYKEKKSCRSASSSPSTSQVSKRRNQMKTPEASSKGAVAADDLEYALQLSLAEERSRAENVPGQGENEYPDLKAPIVGKGKGKTN